MWSMITEVSTGVSGSKNPAETMASRNAGGSFSTHKYRTMSMSGRSSESEKYFTSPKSRNVTFPPGWNR